MITAKFISFSCPACGYSERVRGRKWRTKKPCFGFGTYHCQDCNRLSEIVSEAGKPNFTGGSISWDYIPRVPYCGWCGSGNVEEWNGENPVCPKCGAMMDGLEKCSSKNIRRIEAEDMDRLIPQGLYIIMATDRNDPIGAITLPFYDEVIGDLTAQRPEDNIEGRVLFLASNPAGESISAKYSIASLPTFLLFRKGKYIGCFCGGTGKPGLREEFNNIMNSAETEV